MLFTLIQVSSVYIISLSSKSERQGCCIRNERAKSHINGNRQIQSCGSGRIKGCVIEFSGGESSALFRLERYQGGETSPSLLWMRERAAWRPSLRGTSPMNYSQIGKASYRLLSLALRPSISSFCHLSLLFSPFLCVFTADVLFHSLSPSSSHVLNCALWLWTTNTCSLDFSFSLFLPTTHSADRILVHPKINCHNLLTLIMSHKTNLRLSIKKDKKAP